MNDEQDRNESDNDGGTEWPVLFAYTREQALADGVLADLTGWARESGFTVPVACTASVWHGCLEPPPGSEAEGQSRRGRAHDLLTVLFHACKRTEGDSVRFAVVFVQAREGGGFRQATVDLKAVIGPGDQGEPVLTVMLPSED